MISSRACTTSTTARTRVVALILGAMAVGYALLSVFYFYEDFFKYLGNGAMTMTDRTGWLVSVDGYYLWSILSPWRIVAAILAVALLAASASALWHNRPRARSLALFTVWGVVLPQVLWYCEFVVDWHRGQGIAEVIMIALAAASLPTFLLIHRDRRLVDLECISPNRLLGLAIACGWIGFAATEFLDHSYQMLSTAAYVGALVAIPLAALAVSGIYKLRAWGLWAAVGAAIALAIVPLAASWTGYLHTGGYIDSFRGAAAGSDCRIAISMLIPLVAIWALGAPFLHAFLRKLRNQPIA